MQCLEPKNLVQPYVVNSVYVHTNIRKYTQRVCRNKSINLWKVAKNGLV